MRGGATGSLAAMDEPRDDAPELAYEAPAIEATDSVEALLGGKVSS